MIPPNIGPKSRPPADDAEHGDDHDHPDIAEIVRTDNADAVPDGDPPPAA